MFIPDGMAEKGIPELIDYALLSPAALNCLVSMENRQNCYEAGLSDHAALVLELK